MSDKRKRAARAVMAETGWNYTRSLREADRRHAEAQAEAEGTSAVSPLPSSDVSDGKAEGLVSDTWQTVSDDERGLYEVQFRVFRDGSLRLLRKRTDKVTGRRYGDGTLWLNPPSRELARDGCEYGHWGDLAVADACSTRGCGTRPLETSGPAQQ